MGLRLNDLRYTFKTKSKSKRSTDYFNVWKSMRMTTKTILENTTWTTPKNGKRTT